ncbi:MAG: cytochrome ubiquinol oxidase subunit I [Candidatus Methanodesulfokora sp.]|nr:MAG: cytochrome BD ubiquinol oxidase subunit I [Candidatus Korarchaeota archaeon]
MDLLSQWLSYPAAIDRILSIIGIELHWIILQYVLGLPLVILIALLIHKVSKNNSWLKLARASSKALGIIFAVGAASGTASEFGLVVIWPNVLEAAGRYIYFPLYMEIFAFLIEIIFIYLLIFGWNKLSVNGKIVVAFLALFGAWFSASMIVSVNSYMVAPTGIAPAFSQQSGWLYDKGFPKVLLIVPKDMVNALDIVKLQSLGMDIIGPMGEGVAVYMPSKVVARLAAEAWSGKTIQESVLTAVIKPEVLPGLNKVLVKDLVDAILVKTVRTVGYTSVAFQSPVYLGSILHAFGAALVVTGFTISGAYALLLMLTKRDSEYYRNCLKFGILFSLVAIAVQGTLIGHMIGEEIATYNPEKLAAMEGTSNSVINIPRALGIEGLMKIIIYGNPNANLPDYDSIPADYCSLSGIPAISDCRPPIIIHYIYYLKIGISILLGLIALVSVVLIYMKRNLGFLLYLIAISPVVAQLVSFLGWGTREMGRKPWTIYGIMTVDVAHTANPASPAGYAIIATIFIGILIGLIYSIYRLLFIPSVRGEE